MDRVTDMSRASHVKKKQEANTEEKASWRKQNTHWEAMNHDKAKRHENLSNTSIHGNCDGRTATSENIQSVYKRALKNHSVITFKRRLPQ